MAFIDDLTLILDLLVLITAVVFYTGFFVWFHARRKDVERAASHLREGAALLALLGGVLGIIALWGELTWPFGTEVPLSSYNLYFFDPLAMLAVLLIGFGVAVWYKLPTHFIGMLGVVVGSGVIYYTVRADYYLALTKDPLETLLMYLAFGGMAILAYPATLYVDWFVTGAQTPSSAPLASAPTPAYPKLWTALILLFLIVVVLAGIAAVLYGFNAAWAHLEAPP